ncbi:site-specific integrase [Microbulbifer sp. 2205BS26-8]|uniref:tyrosine-type recombinase/integrase n=1 Tax=Microbulbifer sp. 2205BS26-8 TaxID=3064386 RepID=UPI00273F7271|nr:site-specific integrase [Microbulbifer sp. 2205BS26-8]MDP5210466.1 tyrosine-type recombinase/integrase [Microbulbifer sp. 2205BS26-8]
MGQLTAKTVQAIIKSNTPGRFGDGGGLYLMIPNRGVPYWMLRYTANQKRRSMTLGKVAHVKLAEARGQAEELKQKIRQGVDPLVERRQDQQIKTVDDLFNDWYLSLQKRLKHPSIPKRIYTKDVAPDIGQLKLTAISPVDIRAAVQKIATSGRPTIANDALLYCKQLFNHAIKLDLLSSNPAAPFRVADAGGVERSRDRTLSVTEIKKVFSVFRKHVDSFTRDNYLACALLLALGVRKGELIESKWSEFDLDKAVWALPAERSKSGVAIVIPLPAQAITWLNELQVRACGSEYVFPNRRSSKKPHMGSDTLNRAISKLFGREAGKKKQPPNVMGDLGHFTVHDFRRTCRSLLASNGIPGHVAERCLNHKLKGVEGIYDRHDYFEERKEALAKIANILSPIIDDLPNAIPIQIGQTA